jgi:hypothetical protein
MRSVKLRVRRGAPRVLFLAVVALVNEASEEVDELLQVSRRLLALRGDRGRDLLEDLQRDEDRIVSF